MPESQPPDPRWYRITPDRFLIALLPILGLLFLSERFRWFAFNEHKNWTVLTAVAVVCLAVVLLLLRLGVSFVLRRRFQFSIRSLMLFVAVVAVVCSWFTVKMQQARRQREVVAVAEKGVGLALFDYEFDTNGKYLPGIREPPSPAWLRNLVGVDFLSDVRHLYYEDVTDAKLAHLKELTTLETLHLCLVSDAGLVHIRGLTSLQVLSLNNSQVTDDGLVHLKGLTNLQELRLCDTQVTDAGLVHLTGLTGLHKLSLFDTKVTDAGIKELQKALPNCSILR